jgi:hydrogenase-4 component B
MPGDAPFADSSAAVVLLIAAAVFAGSGVPGLFLKRRSPWGAWSAAVLTLLASLLGTAGALGALRGGAVAVLRLPLSLPGFALEFAVDAVSAFFVLPVLVVGALGALYGLAYWSPRRRPAHGRRLRLCYGAILGSMVLLTIAHDGIAFLVGWEAMALTTFFLVATEEENAEARRAGWLYLLYSHASVLCLFAMFLLANRLTGSWTLGAVPGGAGTMGLRSALFALAAAGFGIKAGLMPLHSWLPAAHAAAPSHVSALLSGVVLKMGVYGLVRISGLLASPPLAWGASLLALGAVAAFFGVVFALAQHDIKRLLAYHSIENVGIMLLGLGLAMVGRTLGRPDWVVLGLGGCLLHVWNHALFKSLLFFGAGSVVHATGTRDIELAGGLGKRMPATAALFLVGAVAICGLPPLNGFVSELLVYLGLARAAVAPDGGWVALGAPVLAATGALAVACFVKVFGIVFLGVPRSATAARAHEAPLLMLVPMGVLALACLLVGAAPVLVAPAVESAVAAWSPASPGLAAAPPLARLAPLTWLPLGAVALFVPSGLMLAALAPRWRRSRRRQPALPTWDCGYAGASPRLQYTASSLAEFITSRFAWALRPGGETPRVEGLFPAPTRFRSHVEDPVLAGLLLPAARRVLGAAARLRSVPQGQLQRYILYTLVTLVALLFWAVVGGP